MNTTKRPAAANDNVRAITMPNDGPTPEWLAERNAAGTATTYRYQTPRIEKALVKEASPHVITLRRIRELMRPAEMAANDNALPDEEEGDQPNPGVDLEVIHNQGSIVPSIPKLLAAYADGMRVRVVSENGKIVGRVCTTYYRDRNGETVRIGGQIKRRLHGLQFQNGELVAYGDKGRRLRPDYFANRTSKETPNPKSLKAQHLQEVTANDNSYANLADGKQAAMPHAYGRIAGISEGKGYAGTTAPRHPVLDEIERAENFASAGIEQAELDVIEAILDDESFRTIGLKFGAADSSAHKTGRRIVERTLQKISERLAA